MAGEMTFIKNQYGKENPAAHGTGVAATRIWPGTIKVPPDRKPDHPTELTGSRIQNRRTVIKQILVDGMTMTMDAAQFQALLMVFAMGLKGNVTGVAANTADYASVFTPSWSASNALDSFSVETGDNIQAFEIDYVMAKRIVISGKLGDDSFVKVEVECFGESMDPVTFTASLTPENGEFMLTNLTKIWIDGTWANLGTTQKTGLLREFSVEILTGLHPKFLANGVKTFTHHGEGSPELAMTLTFETDTVSDGLFDGYQAGTEYAIRLMIEGGPCAVGEDNHSLTIDAFGAFDQIVPLDGDENGNNLTTGIFTATGDREATENKFGVTVVTDRAAP